jgi:hypothetical protein
MKFRRVIEEFRNFHIPGLSALQDIEFVQLGFQEVKQK